MADGAFDDIKGRAKKAGGDLTGNRRMRREGQVDRASGQAKGKIGGVADRVKGMMRRRGTR